MMDAMESRLAEIFRAALKVDGSAELRALVRGETEQWDSLAHVMLVAGVESEFDVSLDLEEALELHTFEDFCRRLREKRQGIGTS